MVIAKQIMENYSLVLLSNWSEHFLELNRDEQLKTFMILQVSLSLLSTIRSSLVSTFCWFLSRNVHAKMIWAVAHSRIEEFLSRIPTGRIMNRFSNDQRNIDQDLLY